MSYNPPARPGSLPIVVIEVGRDCGESSSGCIRVDGCLQFAILTISYPLGYHSNN